MYLKDIDECIQPTNSIRFGNQTQAQYASNLYKWTPCKTESSVCLNKSGGFECPCRPGYERADQTSECEDIDECKLIVSDSDRIAFACPLGAVCENLEGSYRCGCEPGFHNVSHRCEGTSNFRNSMAS